LTNHDCEYGLTQFFSRTREKIRSETWRENSLSAVYNYLVLLLYGTSIYRLGNTQRGIK